MVGNWCKLKFLFTTRMKIGRGNQTQHDRFDLQIEEDSSNHRTIHFWRSWLGVVLSRSYLHQGRLKRMDKMNDGRASLDARIHHLLLRAWVSCNLHGVNTHELSYRLDLAGGFCILRMWVSISKPYFTGCSVDWIRFQQDAHEYDSESLAWAQFAYLKWRWNSWWRINKKT